MPINQCPKTPMMVSAMTPFHWSNYPFATLGWPLLDNTTIVML